MLVFPSESKLCAFCMCFNLRRNCSNLPTNRWITFRAYIKNHCWNCRRKLLWIRSQNNDISHEIIIAPFISLERSDNWVSQILTVKCLTFQRPENTTLQCPLRVLCLKRVPETTPVAEVSVVVLHSFLCVDSKEGIYSRRRGTPHSSSLQQSKQARYF